MMNFLTRTVDKIWEGFCLGSGMTIGYKVTCVILARFHL